MTNAAVIGFGRSDMKLLNTLRDLFSAMSGGERMSSAWQSDAHLRAAIKNLDTNDLSNTEGGLFLADVKEFLGCLDKYNQGLNPKYQFRLVVHKDISEQLMDAVNAPKKSLLGIGAVGNLGLERNGRVYRGEYFNDQVMNTGFVFETSNSRGRFLCGLDKSADFKKFADDLLTVPVYYPAPAWVR